MKLVDIIGKVISGEWGADDEDGDGVPVLRTTNFTNDGVVNYDDVVTRKIQKKNLAVKFLRQGDILIEKSGGSDKQPVGRVVYFVEQERKYLFNNFTGLLRVQDQAKWLPRYVYYALFSNWLNGGTRPFENRTTGLHNLQTESYVKSFNVPEQSLTKQRKIVETLDCVEALIKRRQQQLRTLDDLIKARFVEMFGEPRENPKNWAIYALRQIIKNGNNGLSRRGRDRDGQIVLRLVELQDGYIDYSSTNRIVLTEAEREKYLLCERDFLFARVNGNPDNVGRCAIFMPIAEPVYFNDHIIRVHFDDDIINGQFLSVLLNSRYGKEQFRSHVKTSAGQYTISQDGIGAILVPLPPLKMQLEFASFVAQVDKSKTVIQKALDEAQLLFDSLMQQYFGVRKIK